MDFGALPPEINSARMYLGPGPGTLLAASAGWESLGAELQSTAAGYQSAVSTLTDESWTGPTSMAMQAAVSPYLVWLRTTAGQCEEAATQATAAAAAYESAYAMTVPPPLVATNRVHWRLDRDQRIWAEHAGDHGDRDEYSEMWAQDATAMYNYAASSAAASAVSAFSPPPETTNPTGWPRRPARLSRPSAPKPGRRRHS